MDKKNDTNTVAPWNVGLGDAAMTGLGVGIGAGILGTLATIASPSSLKPLTLATAEAVATILATGATVGKILEEREKYHQAHSSVNASSAQHQGVVSPTQQVANQR
jgi:hypothetical protein